MTQRWCSSWHGEEDDGSGIYFRREDASQLHVSGKLGWTLAGGTPCSSLENQHSQNCLTFSPFPRFYALKPPAHSHLVALRIPWLGPQWTHNETSASAFLKCYKDDQSYHLSIDAQTHPGHGKSRCGSTCTLMTESCKSSCVGPATLNGCPLYTIDVSFTIAEARSGSQQATWLSSFLQQRWCGPKTALAPACHSQTCQNLSLLALDCMTGKHEICGW